MKNQAFTLIELLVVVLIIGILAAIAVPQYQKAVNKSKYNTLKFYAKSLAEAGDRVYLNTGHYPTKFSDLDISYQIEQESHGDNHIVLRISGGITCNIIGDNYIEAEKEFKAVGCWRYFNNNSIMSYYHPYSHSDGQRECWAYSLDENDILNNICKAETGKTTADWQYLSDANVYYY